MKNVRKVCVVIVACIAVAGCSSNPKEFAEKRYSLSNANVCRTQSEAYKSGNYQFASEVQSELNRRGLNAAKCESEMTSQSAGAAVAILGAVLLVAAASKGGGGGGQYNSPVTDYDWAWDQFYNQSYQLVWVCRGKQTGEFATQDKCAYKPQNDFTWPSKSAP